MARIPDSELTRLKRDLPLASLVSASGVKLKKQGKNLIGLCPFHDDREPSLVVNEEENLWHCLGACQMGGSTIDWVMKLRDLSFRQAVELLQKDYPGRKTTVRGKKNPLLKPTADEQELLDKVVDYYHKTLKEDSKVLNYLKERGIHSVEAIKHFKLGLSNRSLGHRLPLKNRKAGAEIRGKLQNIGILRQNGREHFRGSLIIPVFDKGGHVSEVYGRKIGQNLRQGTPKHLYLPGPHKGVWNRKALKSCSEIILCESLIDALTFWCHGFRNVTTSFGTEGFTDDLFQAVKEHKVERLLIAYDRDEAGDRAAVKLAEKLSGTCECFRVLFPRESDVNSYALHVKEPEKQLAELIRNATWLSGAGRSKEANPTMAALEKPRKEELLKASPVPPPQKVAEDLKTESSSDGEVIITLEDRRYRVRGLDRNRGNASLKVNLLVSRGELFHVDTVNLYSARQRGSFVGHTSRELSVESESIKLDLGKILRKLEEIQIEREQSADTQKPVELSEKEKAEALELLRSPDLLDRIVSDFDLVGVVGEELNKLVGYLAAVSRKLDDPLAVIIQSSSAAGKSALLEGILSFVPEEERVKYSAMTGQSLFYMGEKNLKHKVLAIVEEEGAEKASYALKLLQSEGELTIASTGKNGASGKLVTHEYRVEGPTQIMLTTTAAELDEELRNRCLVLTVNEDRKQTRAILDRQRKAQTIEGLLAKRRKNHILQLHRNAQRLLRTVLVANPYAESLTFLDDKTRMRRDHLKYLALIRTICLLNQYKRPVKKIEHSGEELEYIEVTLEDIAVANSLAHEILGRTLDDLAPQTRRLLLLIYDMVQKQSEEQRLPQNECHFTRRQIREFTGWGNTQLKLHMQRLEEFEYLIIHRGTGHSQRFLYELAYDGAGIDGKPFLSGLIDVEKLGAYDANRSGQNTNRSGVNDNRSGLGRGEVGSLSAPGRGEEKAEDASKIGAVIDIETQRAKNVHREKTFRKLSPYSHSRDGHNNEIAKAAREVN